jgi:hypothetical protein
VMMQRLAAIRAFVSDLQEFIEYAALAAGRAAAAKSAPDRLTGPARQRAVHGRRRGGPNFSGIHRL